MDDPLVTYLHDHLAGADHAIDLLNSMRDSYMGEPLGHFASQLLPEIERDRFTLRAIADRAGSASSVVKEVTAWFAGKASRLKLHASPADDFGTFESLEFLCLGVLGKLSLWRALQASAPSDSRLNGFEFASLIARAESQHTDLDHRRLALAPIALKPPSP